MKQKPKGGATVVAQLNNKGAWHKVNGFNKVEHAEFYAQLANVIHEADALAQITKLTSETKVAKMKVTAEQCLATLLDTDAKLQAKFAANKAQPTIDEKIAAKIEKIVNMPVKAATTKTGLTYTVTGKDDGYHSKIKAGKPANLYWIAFKQIAQVQSTYNSKDELINQLIKPAYEASGLRSGNPSVSDLKSMVAYLAREGCIATA